MPDNEMKIILTLVDNATKEIKESLGQVKKSGEESTKKLQDGFKESASQARAFRRDLMLVVGVIAGVVNATREYAKYNKEARESVDAFDASVQKMSISAGKALMPVLKILTMTADGWAKIADLASNVTSGKGFFLTPDNNEINNLITAGQELKNIAETQKQIDNLFLTGKSSFQEYYSALSSSEYLVQNERLTLLNFYKEQFITAHQGMASFAVTAGRSIQSGMSGALTDIVMGTKKASEAFKEFGMAMIRTIVEFMAQKMVAWVMEKTMLAGTVVASSSAAAAIASAWAPAAALVSLATFGANAAPAAAGMASVAALAQGIAATSASGKKVNVAFDGVAAPDGTSLSGSGIQGFAEGGSGIVSRPTLFLAGEAGPERFNFTPMNQGSGGGDVYVEVNYPQMGSQSDVSSLAEQLGFEIERKLRSVRALA
jgi:hypothetical protein